MTVDRFIERVIDQYGSDKERRYPATLLADVKKYLNVYSDENLNYLWGGLVKTYSRTFKRLPGIKELEDAWKEARQIKREHPDIDPRMQYKQIGEIELTEEEVKENMQKIKAIFEGLGKKENIRRR